MLRPKYSCEESEGSLESKEMTSRHYYHAADRGHAIDWESGRLSLIVPPEVST